MTTGSSAAGRGDGQQQAPGRELTPQSRGQGGACRQHHPQRSPSAAPTACFTTDGSATASSVYKFQHSCTNTAPGERKRLPKHSREKQVEKQTQKALGTVSKLSQRRPQTGRRWQPRGVDELLWAVPAAHGAFCSLRPREPQEEPCAGQEKGRGAEGLTGGCARPQGGLWPGKTRNSCWVNCPRAIALRSERRRHNASRPQTSPAVLSSAVVGALQIAKAKPSASQYLIMY